MINKDSSVLFYTSNSSQPITSGISSKVAVTEVNPSIALVISDVPNENVKPNETNNVSTPNMSEDNLLSFLSSFNDKVDSVAEADVNKILSNIPVVVTNRHNAVQMFSSDTKCVSKDTSFFAAKTTTIKKPLDKSIVDGDITGAFAGPNKTYPITNANDLRKVMKESKTNKSTSFQRVVTRAVSIARRYGWLDEDILSDPYFQIKLMDNSKTLCLSQDNKVIETKANVTIFSEQIPEFMAFEDTDNSNKMMLKIPAGRIGKWVHPEYGEVEFTQQKFDEAIDNFNAGVLGYEPTLNVGHWVETQAFGSAPTEGIAVELYQEEDVLYANYECLNACLYNDVLAKKYRRSSSELVMDYVDRTNGREVGMTLVGMALTNRPFITDMPTVSTFSVSTEAHLIDNKPVTFAQFNLYENDNTSINDVDTNTTVLNVDIDNTKLNNTDNINTDKVLNNSNNTGSSLMSETTPITSPTVTTVSVSNEQMNVLSSEIQQVKVAFETAMEAQKLQFTSELANYAKEKETLLANNASLESRIASMEAEKESKLLSEKIKVISELDLSEEQKASYVQMFTDKTFGNADNENTVLSTLVKTFGETKTFNKFTQQLGNTTQSFATTTSEVNPYTSLIERNKANQVK